MSRVVVIGAGLAGLIAAFRLAAGGATVTLLSKGIGGLQLGQGTIDVLGYAPDRVRRTGPVLPASPPSARAPYAAPGAALARGRSHVFLEVVADLRPARRRRRNLLAADGGRRRTGPRPRAGEHRGRRLGRRRRGSLVVGAARAEGLLPGAPRRQPGAHPARRARGRRPRR